MPVIKNVICKSKREIILDNFYKLLINIKVDAGNEKYRTEKS